MDITSLFSTDLTNVSIKRPLLKPGPVVFDITECKVEKSKDGVGDKLVIGLATVYDQAAVKGDTIHPGFKLTESFGITPSERYTPEMIMQKLKRLQVACKREGPFGDPANYIGSRITVNIIVESDANGKYDDQNRVGNWVPKS